MPSVEFEGQRVELRPGDTIASTLYRGGVRTFSRSFKNHRRRGLYCLTGDCPNCLVTVNGDPAVRACTTDAADGMRVERATGWPSAERDMLSAIGRLHWLFPVGFYYKTMLRPRRLWPLAERAIRRISGLGYVPLDRSPAAREARNVHADVLVAGGGPAGLAAALAAAERGASVVLCDEAAIGATRPPGRTRDLVAVLAAKAAASARITILERSVALGVYEGPLVVVDGERFLHLVHPERVIVATGAVERHAVFPGNDLVGIWLGRGAAKMAGLHGVAPGKRAVVAVASREGFEHLELLRRAGIEIAAALVPEVLMPSMPDRVESIVSGEVVEARGRRALRRVVVSAPAGTTSIDCDLLVLSLGLVPRDALLRQAIGLPGAGAGDVVLPGCSLDEAVESGRAAGVGEADATREPELPSPPRDGYVCLCEDVAARDLAQAWDEGFRSTELLKRYTNASMGPCQGALCQGPLCSFVHSRTGEPVLSARTTSRPPARPLTLEQAAAGRRDHLEARTCLHARHLELGATMEWAGIWKRPETYGDVAAEYWAVRRRVSVMDVGTLAKFLVAGPDATAFLERLYPCRVEDIPEGRLRYTLLLNEAGYVIDDGIVCALGDGRYYVTFTSGGGEQAEAWIRDWAETWGMRVHLVNRTAALGAINVTGPRARDLLARLSSDSLDCESFPYLRHGEIEVAGIPCRAIRLSFVGELSYELHHPSSESVSLWDALLGAGADLEIRPHGLEALRLLRLEKGHIIVGQDTDFDTTPSKLGLDWVVRMEKDDFVGRTALARIAKQPLERKLARFVLQEGEAPAEGTPLTAGGRHVGYLTSSRQSPVLERPVALGWLARTNGDFPAVVDALGARGEVVTSAFYDPEGERLRA